MSVSLTQLAPSSDPNTLYTMVLGGEAETIRRIPSNVTGRGKTAVSVPLTSAPFQGARDVQANVLAAGPASLHVLDATTDAVCGTSHVASVNGGGGAGGIRDSRRASRCRCRWSRWSRRRWSWWRNSADHVEAEAQQLAADTVQVDLGHLRRTAAQWQRPGRSQWREVISEKLVEIAMPTSVSSVASLGCTCWASQIKHGGAHDGARLSLCPP